MGIIGNITLWFIALTLVCIFGILSIFYLAKKHKKFFILVPEGKIITAMIGKKATKYLGKIRGYWVDPESGEVTKEEKLTTEQIKRRDSEKNLFDQILESFGISWLGFWPFVTIYNYRFKWNEWNKKENSTEYELISRDEKVDSIFFRFPYPVKVDNVETKGKVPITVLVLITTKIINADKALFKAGGEWLANVSGAVQAVIRDYIGHHELEDLTSLQHEAGDSGFIQAIMDLNTSIKGNRGLADVFGVEIDMANFLSYEIGGPEGEKLRDASTKKYVASQEAEANRVKASGDADAVRTRARGDAEAIETKAKAEANAIRERAEAKAKEKELLGTANADATKKMFDSLGGEHPDIALAKAIKETKVTTLILGEKIIPTIPISKED